jgi:cell division protein FtsZ
MDAAPQPAMPSADKLERLREVAAKAQRPSMVPPPATQPASLPPRARIAAAEVEGEAPAAPEKSRFGINSLIGRMTGGAGQGEPSPAPRAAASEGRVQPPLTTKAALEERDPDQERIEIPAFLRRQAN